MFLLHFFIFPKNLFILLRFRYNRFGDTMKTIEQNVICEQTINKSRFICQLIPVASLAEAKSALSAIKKSIQQPRTIVMPTLSVPIKAKPSSPTTANRAIRLEASFMESLASMI